MSGVTGSTVPELPSAGTLTGAEVIYLVQSNSDVKATLTALAVFTGAGYLPLTGGTVSGVLTLNGTVSGTGVTNLFASPPAIGGSAPAAGAFTTLSATSTVSGAGFTAWAASPPSIGSTAPGTGAFTTLSATSTISGAGFTAWLASPPAIGGTAPAAGAFTTLSASSTVSGAGFDAYLALGTKPASFTTLAASGTVSGAGFTARFATPGPIGNTSASTGQFTTLQATSTITPSSTAGIVGTTTNDNANAGSIGEYISSSVLIGSQVSLVNSTTKDVTTAALTAGDWDVRGMVCVNNTGGATFVLVGISNTANTLGTAGAENNQAFITATLPASAEQRLPVGPMRVSLSGSQTQHLLANEGFTTTGNAYGFIGARRVR